jgi:hypothetical protein
VVAAAGELATRYGLTGWDEGEARKAALACFVSWYDLFGGSGSREERLFLDQVRDFFERNGSSRFESISQQNDRVIHNRAGFYRTVVHQQDGEDVPTREYLVLPEVLKEVYAGFDRQFALRTLKKHGWLMPNPDGNNRQYARLPEMGPRWVYVFGGPAMWSDK